MFHPELSNTTADCMSSFMSSEKKSIHDFNVHEKEQILEAFKNEYENDDIDKWFECSKMDKSIIDSILTMNSNNYKESKECLINFLWDMFEDSLESIFSEILNEYYECNDSYNETYLDKVLDEKQRCADMNAIYNNFYCG